jgi:hypothetical protein
MTDIEMQEQRRLWETMRAIQPPPAARVRVLEAVERQGAARPRWLFLMLPAAAAAAALALLVMQKQQEPQAPSFSNRQVVAAHHVTQNGKPLQAGQIVGDGLVSVAPKGHLEVFLNSGALNIEGDASVQGPSCTATTSGKSEISVSEGMMQVRVFSGSGFVKPPVETCMVIFEKDLAVAKAEVEEEPEEELIEEEEVVAEEETITEEEPKVVKKPRKKITDVELNRQTTAYWRAQKLRDSEPAKALKQLRLFKKRWPRSPLRQEVELATIDTLVQLGRAKPAKSAARLFLKRYPKSPRAKELRAMIQESE